MCCPQLAWKRNRVRLFISVAIYPQEKQYFLSFPPDGLQSPVFVG